MWGDGHLPHYLPMHCVNEMHRQHEKVGKSSQGTALTGCYSTLLESAEGRGIANALGASSLRKTCIELLMSRVGTKQDADHPKVKAVVECVIDACTARRLRDILGERIVDEFSTRG